MSSILMQADEIILKTVGISEISETIKKKLSNPMSRVAMMAMKKERASVILERETESTIQNWLSRVECTPDLTAVQLDPGDRTGHVRRLISDLVRRLLYPPSSEAPSSKS